MKTQPLSPHLVERVLMRLELSSHPAPTPEALSAIYGAWCRRVPFDNVRKLIRLRAGNAAPLPGSTAEDFFEAWLKHGVGGTCWSGAGAWHALLTALGFEAARGVGTMLAAPGLPPNHGTVVVTFGTERFLVDCSILHGKPLPLSQDTETSLPHGAWGVECRRRHNHWWIAWRPLHRLEGLECRLEYFGAQGEEFQNRYEQTRSWSPFNYELSVRINRDDRVLGAGFGHKVCLNGDGTVCRSPMDHFERTRFLVEEVGVSEEMASQLPPDVPTPPPPGSNTALQMARAS